MNKFKALFIIFAMLCMGACTRHREQTTNDQLDNVQVKIDHEQYADAENDLQKILQKEPNNERARVILASVYVHKAGIRIKDYFVLESLTHDPEMKPKPAIDPKIFEKLKIKDSAALTKATEFLQQVNDVSSKAQDMANRFAQIPGLTDQGADEIYTALNELEKLQNPSEGSALYRGVIKLLYFKYLVVNGRFLSFGQEKFCSQSLGDLTDRLSVFSNFTSGMVRDLAHGFPKSKASLNARADQIQTAFQVALQSIQLLGEPTASVKEALIALNQSKPIEGFACDF